MLNSNPIKLTENQKILVKVKSPKGDIYDSEITLEHGRLPSISKIREGEKELIVYPFKLDRRGNYYITDFFDYQAFNLSVFKYLFFGKANKDQIKKVDFIIPELTSYFQNELSFKFNDQMNISGKLKIEPLQVRIDSLGLSIEVYQECSLKSNDDHAGFSFQNIMYFSFESDKALSFRDIEILMYKLINLLTWVMGYPISPESIEVSDGKEHGYLYIPLAKRTSKYNISQFESFMDLRSFRKYFQTICGNYFEKKEIFEDIWSRTAPLFNFTGMIEYEVMLYASILDRYFSYRVSELNIFEDQNCDSHFSKIEDFLNNNEEFKALLEEADLAGKLDVKNLLSQMGDKPFIQKQKAYFKHLTGNNLKIFIEKGDFHKIKSIRDRAAHGSREVLDTETVYKYLWKVKLLTMYFIYRDLGIKEDDFFKMVSSTFHPIALNCEKDRYLLDMITGKTISIKLEKSEIEKFKNLNTKINVFNKENDKYFFNSDLSEMASNYFSEDLILKMDAQRFYSYEEYIQYLLDQRGVNLATQYYVDIYLEEKNSKTKISNVVILSQPIDQL